jgi:hypothetical protein
MTHHPPTLTARRLGAATLIGLALLIISVSIFQPAAAQLQPPSLKPPFHLIRTDTAAPLIGLPPLPPNASIIVSETFDDHYLPVGLDQVGWHEEIGEKTTVGYTWARVTNGPHPNSVWQMGRNKFAAGSLQPGVDSYTNSMESLLIYGPLNLGDYSSALISATYWLDVQSHDYFGVAVSTDGSNFKPVASENSRDDSLSRPITSIVDLSNYTRQGNVWIALYFTSNDDNNVALGVMIDSVVMRGVPLYKFYLSFVRRDFTPTPTNTPTPTRTPTPTATPVISYLYNDTFGNGSDTADANFIAWGKRVSSADCFYGTDSSSCKWGQDLQTGGNLDGSLMMYQNGFYSWAGASPNTHAPLDFEFSADIFVMEPKKNARFGLIFDASDSTFGRDGDGVPFFDPNRNLYKFDLQFDENTDTTIRYYRLEACQNSIQTCAPVVAKAEIPASYVFNVGSWNNIRVQRLGANLKVYLNNNLLINSTDSTHIRAGKYGVFLQSKEFNSTSNPLKIKIDNVRIKALP